MFTNNVERKIELSVDNPEEVTPKIMFTPVVTNNLREEFELSVDNAKEVTQKVIFVSVH